MDDIILENEIKKLLEQQLLIEASKVKRDEYNRMWFKIEELQNTLGDAIKELRRLEDSIPEPLKKISGGKLNSVSTHINESQKVLNSLKNKIRDYKRKTYLKQIEEKRKS